MSLETFWSTDVFFSNSIYCNGSKYIIFKTKQNLYKSWKIFHQFLILLLTLIPFSQKSEHGILEKISYLHQLSNTFYHKSVTEYKLITKSYFINNSSSPF